MAPGTPVSPLLSSKANISKFKIRKNPFIGNRFPSYTCGPQTKTEKNPSGFQTKIDSRGRANTIPNATCGLGHRAFARQKKDTCS